ncbi:MAG: OmpH family outer membrane protein [Chlorobiaceae bacterium]|nr:OmpH family outer membrane protein [Chlorobiaceae bacterium]NTW74699.1 OmpH family outer membrane protein [Chlorobiaceae bacterium]
MSPIKELQTISRRILMAIALCMLLSTSSAFAAGAAQKIGVVDYGKIFQQMPETKAAEQSLQAAKTQTSNELNKLSSALQSAAQAYQKAGKQNPVKEKELRAQDESLRKTAAEKQGLLIKKEQELITPIRLKIDNAIESIAKKEGFNMIFDKAVRYYGEAEYDITFKVMDQLNIK